VTGAIWLTLKLASLTTAILLVVGTPIAWWLARTRSWLRGRSARWWPCPWCCRRR
jgi:ABC-type molybdate transport system permease subunit